MQKHVLDELRELNEGELELKKYYLQHNAVMPLKLVIEIVSNNYDKNKLAFPLMAQNLFSNLLSTDIELKEDIFLITNNETSLLLS